MEMELNFSKTSIYRILTQHLGLRKPNIFTSSLRSILLLYVDEGYHLVLFGMWLFDTSFQGFTFYESGVGEFSIRTGEKPLILMQQWIHEFMLTVKQLHPQFIALHLQEVGGKTYEQSSHYVKEFVKSLCEAYEMQEFSIVRIYLDENFNSQEQFTALGNLYFGHNTIPNSRLWNFKNCSWETTQGKNFYFGNIENVPTKDKSKFPLDFFPECKWSRKGFMRTRWNINGTILDFVNMHLFHDASNLTALIEFPSVYSQRRRKALIHTLQRFDMDKDNEIVPYFLFGDFNFRSDSAGVIKLKQYDRDLEICKGILFEYEITFSPSYPYEEKPELPTRYLTTRCPSWCDRVLMSAQMNEITINRNTSYNLIGDNICMGDHKPVYLNIQIKSNQGIIKPPVSVRKYLHHISNNLRSNDHTILKCPDKSEPTYQFIKLNKTRNITTQSNLDTGFSTNNMNEYIEIPSWINSIAGQAFTILRETFF
ncbi:inositol polyphosphate-5-phosphatase A isoform X4 [Bactrocera tryoni]|uniref:inositol polyphosphate-5-phosphatase A isoform X4 n=1 Tax=Bactrocera tryoni TaxID=59916 RepID=UPI001A96B835|nr:inositol polyphosphate-5-phosphatase A isoform X4 [Bactrocera tryoni]